MYTPKAQAFFLSDVTKLQTFQHCPVSLSLSLSLSNSLQQQLDSTTRRSGKSQAFSQGRLAIELLTIAMSIQPLLSSLSNFSRSTTLLNYPPSKSDFPIFLLTKTVCPFPLTELSTFSNPPKIRIPQTSRHHHKSLYRLPLASSRSLANPLLLRSIRLSPSAAIAPSFS